MNRRLFFSSASSLLVLSSVTFAQKGLVELPEDYSYRFKPGEEVPSLSKLIQQGLNNLGPGDPLQADVFTALEIMAAVPLTSKTSSYDVALWFARMRQNRLQPAKPDWTRFGEEFQTINGNPLIMGFFDATTYGKPDGDQTAWCSAFTSWCIEKAGSQNSKIPRSTRSAASKSYRTWARKVDEDNKKDEPQKGDVVVFRNSRNDNRGHVGFFDGFSDVRDSNGKQKIRTLGGNQRQLGTTPKTYLGEINVKEYSRTDGSNKFHSFRTLRPKPS